MSPNNGILLDGFLRPKLFNISFASCSFIDLDFLLPHRAHFDDVLPFLVLLLLNLHFSYLICTSNNISTCFTMIRI